jgi:hypothetical protein
MSLALDVGFATTAWSALAVMDRLDWHSVGSSPSTWFARTLRHQTT